MAEGRPNVTVTGVNETLSAFNRLPKEANQTLRERTKELAAVLAADAQSAGGASDAQSAAVAPTVRARKDRIPKVAAGGAKRVASTRTPAHKIFFGAEFGANLPQFRPHKGREGYWLWPTIREGTEETARVWQDILDEVARDFTRGDVGGAVS